MDNLLRCLIVDDEPLALALLSDYAVKVPGLELVRATSDPMLALQQAKSGQVDLIFLDMQMPELNGLQFLNILQRRCMVIITTAYEEYALQGYEHQVVDYLLKPITLDRFLLAVERANERIRPIPVPTTTLITQETKSYIFVRTDHRQVRISLDEIYYLEAARDYVIIHTSNGQVLTLESLRSLEEALPARLFQRVHRSYIIALNKIRFIERNRIAINEQLIPVSDTYRKDVEQKIGLKDRS